MDGDTTIIGGIVIPSTDPAFLAVIVGVHIPLGIAGVFAGAVAILLRKGRGRHSSFGTIYFWCLLALFTFTGQWNSFLWPLIAVNGPDHATLPLGLTMFQGQQGTQWNYMMAGATISMLPGLLLTILMHRYIFKSIAIGSGFGGR